MEKTRQAIHSIGRMLFTQCVEMINPATSRGLPPNLVGEDPSTSAIFKGTDIHMAALQAELGFLAGPVNSVQTAELGNQLLNSLALISARYTSTAADVLSEMAAAHLVAACQALDLRALHLDFLEAYRPRFIDAIREAVGGCSCQDTLQDSMWTSLCTLFDQTVQLDPDERFASIITSQRHLWSDLTESHFCSACVKIVQKQFVDFLQSSLQDTWCANRDAYLLHGNASSRLGYASRRMYSFVRDDLGVPMLCTPRLLTPQVEAGASGEYGPAPTVGQYTSTVYRAVRDGTMAMCLLSIMQDLDSEETGPEESRSNGVSSTTTGLDSKKSTLDHNL